MAETRTRDAWESLRALTAARIALGRAGASLPTAAWLDFKLAHARARDAVWRELEVERLAAEIVGLGHGLGSVEVRSAAETHEVFLRRPDLGRVLAAGEAARLSAAQLPAGHGPWDLALLASGGLSATAVHEQLIPLLAALMPELSARALSVSPVVLARFGRVALGDPVGAALGARAILVLVGERPGLATPSSLGAYLTFAPREGRSDAERNCVSNIHAGGLSHAAAARKIAWLTGEALRRGLSGVALKDEEGLLSPPTRQEMPRGS